MKDRKKTSVKPVNPDPLFMGEKEGFKARDTW